MEPALQQLIDTGALPARGRALVPGCGRGYAVAALASPTRHVLGLEISPSGAAVAKAQLAGVCNVAVVVGDFFGPFLDASDPDPAVLAGRYDLIYDCTFLCALLPAQRALWPGRMRQLLRPGGVLVTDVFPVGTHTTGPPFAMSPQLLRSLLEPAGFSCRSIAVVPPELVARPKTKSGEMIAVWVREDRAEVPTDEPTAPSTKGSPPAHLDPT